MEKKRFSIKYICSGQVLAVWEGDELASPSELNSHLELQLIKNRVRGYLFMLSYVEIWDDGVKVTTIPFQPRPA